VLYEQILRVMTDGDKCDVIYLPPRSAGDRLPVELQDAYEGQYSALHPSVVAKLTTSLIGWGKGRMSPLPGGR